MVGEAGKLPLLRRTRGVLREGLAFLENDTA
jgi:hypothetical protein